MIVDAFALNHVPCKEPHNSALGLQMTSELGNEYKTRTEWHRIISWNKLAEWAGTLPKGAYIEIEGELRYREYTPAESDRSVRVTEIHASSILALDRSNRQPVSTPESEPADEPVD